jgi:hypothetical protein
MQITSNCFTLVAGIHASTSTSSMMHMMIVKVMVMIATNVFFPSDRPRLQRSKSGRIRILFRQFDKYYDHGVLVDLKLAASFQQMTV